MDLSKIVPVSERIILAEVYPPFRVYEESDNRDDWTWVKVRKALEADNLRRSPYLQTSTMRYLDSNGTTAVAESIETGNIRDRIIHEIYWTLEEVGNLTREEKPIFPTPIRELKIDDFIGIWHSLPVDLTAAIYTATLTVNTLWASD